MTTQDAPLVTDGSDHLYAAAAALGEAEMSRCTVASFKASADFFRTLQQLSVCCGREDRPILAGVFVTAHASGVGLELVATDTFRLWRKHVPATEVDIPHGISEGLIIPREFIKKTVPQIIKENGGNRKFDWWVRDVPFMVIEVVTIATHWRRTRDVHGTVVEHEDLVRVQSTQRKLLVGAEGTYETLLVDGQYVNYTRVCPPEAEVQAIFGLAGKALAPALAFCGAVADRNEARVSLGLDEAGTLTVRAAYYDRAMQAKAEAEYPIEAACQKGEGNWQPFQIGLNYRYLLDFIGDCPGFIELRYFGRLSSFMLQKGTNDYYVQMPMQLFDAAGNPLEEEGEAPCPS